MKKHWNYRVVRETRPPFNESDPADGTRVSYSVREVYYEDDKPVAASRTAYNPLADHESVEEIRRELEKIERALDMPVLDESEIGNN